MSTLCAVALVLVLGGHPRAVKSVSLAAPPAPVDVAKWSLPQLVEQMRRLEGELELDRLVPVARELGSRGTASLELRSEAWVTLARALVAQGDLVAAERPLVQVLRADPAFTLESACDPKLTLVFRKVQAEERELALELHDAQRTARAQALQLEGGPTLHTRGGEALPFAYRLVDSAGSVRVVRVAWRVRGEPVFSSLALVRSDEGDSWSGALAAELTQSGQGLTIEYFVEAADAEGPLRAWSSSAAPAVIEVPAGMSAQSWRAPLPRGLFFLSSALTVGAGAVGTALFVNYREQQAGFERFASQATVDYALLEHLRPEGDAAAFRATVGLVSAASALVVTVVVALLTDWRG